MQFLFLIFSKIKMRTEKKYFRQQRKNKNCRIIYKKNLATQKRKSIQEDIAMKTVTITDKPKFVRESSNSKTDEHYSAQLCLELLLETLREKRVGALQTPNKLRPFLSNSWNKGISRTRFSRRKWINFHSEGNEYKNIPFQLYNQ